MRTLGVLAIAMLIAGHAAAQNAEIPGLIKLVELQPADMDRTMWKEKRRDAARKLGQSKDKRATPVLAKLAEIETFDIVGEIAIEGLGNLGDLAAVPTLQKIAADNSRDKTQRDLARRALAKLGASETALTTVVVPAGTGLDNGAGAGSGSGIGGATATGASGSDPTTIAPDASHLLGVKVSEDAPVLPILADDTIAAYERLTLAGGTAALSYDTIRKRADFSADLTAIYQKRIEREKTAWGIDAGAHVVLGLVNPDGRAISRGAQIEVHGVGEARFYSGAAYGVGKLALATQIDYVSYVDPNPGNPDFKQTELQADVQLALGGGYGRLLDVGAAIRVRRLARTLDAARALGRPIDPQTAKRLQLTWWSLRGERSGYRALVATVAILREAGILLGEPDAGLSYEILNVLRDSQLFMRPSGFDAQLTVGEGYLRRPAGLQNTVENGRIEQVLAQAGYGSQLEDDKLEISGNAYARARILAADGEPTPWAAGVHARMRRFTYGEHGDPFGLFDLAGDVRVSSDAVPMTSHRSLRIAGELGFTYLINQASGIRLAAQVAEDGGAFFIGGHLQITYGLLDGIFSR